MAASRCHSPSAATGVSPDRSPCIPKAGGHFWLSEVVLTLPLLPVVWGTLHVVPSPPTTLSERVLNLSHHFCTLNFKKIGKTTRLFRYDLNQNPYDYTVEVTNRFKGLDLVERVPKELRTEVCNTAQEEVIKTIPKKKKCKKAK